MGYEPYTTEQLVQYYQRIIGGLKGFDIKNIYLVNDLKIIADQYKIKEVTNNMNGFTIPLDNCVVALRNTLDGFQAMIALFHELTHVHDFFEFSNNYHINIDNINEHYLFYALQMYSEINAYYLGYKLTIEFLMQKNPLMKQFSHASMNPIDVQMGALCKKEILLDDIFQCVGYLLLNGYFDDSENYLEYLPDSVSPRLREAIEAILQAYFDHNIEEINSIISLLCHR